MYVYLTSQENLPFHNINSELNKYIFLYFVNEFIILRLNQNNFILLFIS
jgi:hypothetical protein